MKIKLIKEIKHYVDSLSPWDTWPIGTVLHKEPDGFINRKIATCWISGLKKDTDYIIIK